MSTANLVGLHHAVLERAPGMVRILMRHGAEAREGVYPHREATTAHAIAVQRGYDEIVRIIEAEEQMRRDAQSGHARTPSAGELFRAIVRGTARPGLRLVLGGQAEGIATGLSGWQVDAKRSRQGVLLSPQQTTDGDLIGVRLPRSIAGQPVQPGRGLVHLGDGSLLTVAVPTPAPPPS